MIGAEGTAPSSGIQASKATWWSLDGRHRSGQRRLRRTYDDPCSVAGEPCDRRGARRRLPERGSARLARQVGGDGNDGAARDIGAFEAIRQPLTEVPLAAGMVSSSRSGRWALGELCYCADLTLAVSDRPLGPRPDRGTTGDGGQFGHWVPLEKASSSFAKRAARSVRKLRPSCCLLGVATGPRENVYCRAADIPGPDPR